LKTKDRSKTENLTTEARRHGEELKRKARSKTDSKSNREDTEKTEAESFD